MPGDTATAGMAQDYEKGGTPLTGMPGNPARDPKRKTPKSGPGSMGDTAFKDALLIVILAWVVVILLAFSLRHHNV